MSLERYKDIKGKIVSRREGILRKQIDENYDVEHGIIVPKSERISDIIVSEKGPLVVASKDPADDRDNFKKWICTNSGFIQGCTSVIDGMGHHPTVLGDIQTLLADCNQRFVFVDKTRQIGFSFIMAARALSESMLEYKHTSIFVSYCEEESKEKITYAKELYESLPWKYRMNRKLKYDNKTSLVFEKSGPTSAETRILSYPQRIIRGKGLNVHVRIDEAAHCIHLREIYTSALPVLTRGASSFWIGSSPKGKGGLFYEIGSNQDGKYPLYTRIHIHWWDVKEFCTDVRLARLEAPGMITDERVDRFAAQSLKEIRMSMLLDDFQQEYECAYLDEAYAYYPWDQIMACVPIFDVDSTNTTTYDAPAPDLKHDDKIDAGKGIEYFTDWDDFYAFFSAGRIKGNLLLGFDVGRSQHASEVIFIEEDSASHHQIVRCCITMKNVSLPDQREKVLSMIQALGNKLIKAGIDYNGLGLNIAEDIENFAYELLVKLPFNNNAWKETAAKDFKYRMHMGGLSLPTDRGLLNQIHSIKRILLPGGAFRFDTEKNDKHHGDKFWAMVAASAVGHSVITADAGPLDLDRRIFQISKNQQKIAQIGRKVDILMPSIPDNGIGPYSNLPMNNPFRNLPVPSYGGMGIGTGAQEYLKEELVLF